MSQMQPSWSSTVYGSCYVEQFDTGRPDAFETVFPTQDIDLGIIERSECGVALERWTQRSTHELRTAQMSSTRRSLNTQQELDDLETRRRGLREATRLSVKQRTRARRELQEKAGQAVADRAEPQATQPLSLHHFCTQEKQRREQTRDLPHANYVRRNYDTLLDYASRRELTLNAFSSQRQERVELETYSGQRSQAHA